MTTERDIYIVLERRRFHKLRRLPKWRIEFSSTPSGFTPRFSQSGEADTVNGAWDAAIEGASIIFSLEPDSPCPWDENGKLL